MKIALLQLNPLINDLEGNADKIIKATARAKKMGADLCVTSELALIGYPPRDLLFNQRIIENCYHKAGEIAQTIADAKDFCPLLLGIPLKSPQKNKLYNGVLYLDKGEIKKTFGKSLLPNYDVFDEERYFLPYPQPEFLDFKGVRIGITICEDIWNDKDFWQEEKYSFNPVELLADQGVEIILNLSASPFSLGKQIVRQKILAALARKYKLPILYCNQVGGNDDLIFDGRSCAVDHQGRLQARAKGFTEDILMVDIEDRTQNRIEEDDFSLEAEAWQALVLGTRDYIHKCGFKKALLGLSGGIDSSLCAAIAAHAIGPENVLGVLMPSPYTSKQSIQDARSLAQNLNIKTLTLPIENLMLCFDQTLQPVFADRPRDVTEENIQSRIRGNLLMALSNKFGSILITTGNKSELAVGYCTIYGDMSGGLAIISDVPKTMVYRLCRWLNKQMGKDVIPASVLQKPPSAELKPDQKDEDTLPPYSILDEILNLYIEKGYSIDQIITKGFDASLVKRIADMVKKAEFKRQQAPPGLKITDRAFGTGWRMPIARK